MSLVVGSNSGSRKYSDSRLGIEAKSGFQSCGSSGDMLSDRKVGGIAASVRGPNEPFKVSSVSVGGKRKFLP